MKINFCENINNTNGNMLIDFWTFFNQIILKKVAAILVKVVLYHISP